MRALSLIGLLGFLSLSTGCQHLHLTPAASSSTASVAISLPTVSRADKIKGSFLSLYAQLPWTQDHQSMTHYEAACVAQSRLYQPVRAGNVINTPRYALVTLQRQDNVIMGGELCIVNKVTHSIELTAVDTLQFVPRQRDAISAP
jgi:hypothetical protein